MGMGGVLVRSPGLLSQEWRWGAEREEVVPSGGSGTICREPIGKQDLAGGCREEGLRLSEEMESGSGSRNGLSVRQATFP